MNDVARVAGVGTMTVSRVLNGSQHVSPETAARVMQAIAELRYHPNEMARALRNSKSRTIGVLLPSLNDPFYATCAHSLNVVAKQHGYTTLLTLTNEDPDHEYQEALRMLQRHVEGLVIIPTSQSECRLASPEFSEIPIVTLDRLLPESNERAFDSVVTENEAGMRTATQHLIEVHGHRNILFLGHKPGMYTMVERYRGYEQAMLAAGLTPRYDLSCVSDEAAAEILCRASKGDEPVTAVVTANNLSTRHVLSVCLHTGIRIPEKLALLGFDDLELGDLLHPALTVVRQPMSELGERAGQLLFERLKARAEQKPVERVVLPTELILRHSCGCAYQPSTVN